MRGATARLAKLAAERGRIVDAGIPAPHAGEMIACDPAGRRRALAACKTV
ncbi:MAG: hypothetical protein WDN25_06320 [Acetobacteraceae bacterium]